MVCLPLSWNFNKIKMRHIVFIFGLLLLHLHVVAQQTWHSQHVKYNENGVLMYTPDEKGNSIPDFSEVGYKGGKELPLIPVVKTLYPSKGDDGKKIQQAIDELAKKKIGKDGFRGAILLAKGIYDVSHSIKISASGIVLRGEGNETKLVASGKGKRNLITVSGAGSIQELAATRREITDDYVHVGAKSFRVSSTKGLKVGDRIVVFRPGTRQWISDLKMDRIDAKANTKQWQPAEYDLHFERKIRRIEGNFIFIDYPIVMAMETKYGGGAIYQYHFGGRIENVGIENLLCQSAYASDEDEDHGWNAISFNKVENGWVKKVTAKYFGYSGVNLGYESRNITVDSCQSLEPKSKITGGRRYSFNNDGQFNLVMNCYASEGRHDYVTGQKVRGPNVFYNCRAENAKSDIGPHHRWSLGTLYDNIVTDGEINVQDRGNWGSGHGWSGVTQVIWNCVAARAAIQDPWVSGRNYVIGLKSNRYEGRLKGRPQTVWEDEDKKSLVPTSLYRAQVTANKQPL